MRIFIFLLLLSLNLPTYSQTYSIEGKVRYKNNIHSRFRDSCYLTLTRNDTIITLDTVGSDSYYHFYNLPTGTYKINVSCNKLWVGGGSTDALIIIRHFVGMHPLLTGLNLLAGDPSNDHLLSAVDGLYIKCRFVGFIDSFPSGDWVFENPVVHIVNANVLLNINGLCIGDTNGSGIPLNTVPDAP